MRLLFSGKSPRANLHPLLFFLVTSTCLAEPPSLFPWVYAFRFDFSPAAIRLAPGFPSQACSLLSLYHLFFLPYRHTLSPGLSHIYLFYSYSFSTLYTSLQTEGIGCLCSINALFSLLYHCHFWIYPYMHINSGNHEVGNITVVDLLLFVLLFKQHLISLNC